MQSFPWKQGQFMFSLDTSNHQIVSLFQFRLLFGIPHSFCIYHKRQYTVINFSHHNRLRHVLVLMCSLLTCGWRILTLCYGRCKQTKVLYSPIPKCQITNEQTIRHGSEKSKSTTKTVNYNLSTSQMKNHIFCKQHTGITCSNHWDTHLFSELFICL